MSTVRLNKEDEELLERLKARYVLMGRKITKKDLIGQLIKKETKRIEYAQVSSLPPLENDVAWQLLEHPKSWGIQDTSITVDEFLYHGREE